MNKIRALVSVRSVDEALMAADAGVTLIDLKEPRDGALGALPLDRIRAIVGALRARAVEISATIGDAVALADVERVAACGVDVVKVGVESAAMLQQLAALPHRIVPVLIADRGLHDELVAAACRDFDTIMLDTADKLAGSLFDVLSMTVVRRFIGDCRRRGRRAGIAGALRLSDLPRVRESGPDFAGFRSAVCDGGLRGDALNAQRLQAVLAGLGPVHTTNVSAKATARAQG